MSGMHNAQRHAYSKGMRILTYLSNTHMHTHIHTDTCTHTHIHTDTCTHTHTHTYTHMHAHTHSHRHMHAHTRTHTGTLYLCLQVVLG